MRAARPELSVSHRKSQHSLPKLSVCLSEIRDYVRSGWCAIISAVVRVAKHITHFDSEKLHALHHVTSLSSTASWALREPDIGVVHWHTRLVSIPLRNAFHGNIIHKATASATDGSVGEQFCSAEVLYSPKQVTSLEEHP
ncbi:hypothetical protein F5141DRAFT_451918 [Pisolithus sp. B1]|nr:hypothetical protein F5141DRAFT_451918 [Pisolithus sp. B1]